jgi:hypothetical protein
VTDSTRDDVPPTEWHDLQGRHLWKVRAFFDPGPEHRGWHWQAYLRSPTRNAGMGSTSHLDAYQYARWPSEDEALREARDYLLEWERKRPDFLVDRRHPVLHRRGRQR